MNLGNGIFVSLALYTKNNSYFIDYVKDEEKGNHLNIICCEKNKEANKKEFTYKIEKDYLLFDEYLADCIRVVNTHTEYLEKLKIVQEKEKLRKEQNEKKENES